MWSWPSSGCSGPARGGRAHPHGRHHGGGRRAVAHPPPPGIPAPTLATQLLGFTPPPALTPARLVTQLYPDAVFALGCLAALALYAAGVRVLHRRGDRWPRGRTLAWTAGVLVVALMALTGMATYGSILLSVHMTQHMVLATVAPSLLVLGGPVTLALRALPNAGPGSGVRSALLAFTRSRLLATVTHPLVAFALFVTAPFLVYFTGLFDVAMRHHSVHTLMTLHFLLVGYLFYDLLIGVDPLPRRPHHAARLVLLMAATALHAFFGVALMQSTSLLAEDYYRALAGLLDWMPDPLDEQHLAGALTWGAGEIVPLIVIAALIVQWMRSDDREAGRFDRREADAEAQLAAYNACLASLEPTRRRRG